MRCGRPTRNFTSGSWRVRNCCCRSPRRRSPAAHRWAGAPGTPVAAPTCSPSPRPNPCGPAWPNTPGRPDGSPITSWPARGRTTNGGSRSTRACRSRAISRRGSSPSWLAATYGCPGGQPAFGAVRTRQRRPTAPLTISASSRRTSHLVAGPSHRFRAVLVPPQRRALGGRRLARPRRRPATCSHRRRRRHRTNQSKPRWSTPIPFRPGRRARTAPVDP